MRRGCAGEGEPRVGRTECADWAFYEADYLLRRRTRGTRIRERRRTRRTRIRERPRPQNADYSAARMLVGRGSMTAVTMASIANSLARPRSTSSGVRSHCTCRPSITARMLTAP